MLLTSFMFSFTTRLSPHKKKKLARLRKKENHSLTGKRTTWESDVHCPCRLSSKPLLHVNNYDSQAYSSFIHNCSRIYIKFWDLYTCKMHLCPWLKAILEPPSSLFSFINSKTLSNNALSAGTTSDSLWVAIFIWNNRILYCKLPLHPMQWVGQPKHRKLPSFHIYVIYSIYACTLKILTIAIFHTGWRQ